MPILTVNGVDLEFSEAGDLHPIVLIHGSAADRTSWDGVIPLLAMNHRVIAYSRRYHAPNEKIVPGHDYSMQEHVEDLISLVDQLDLDNPVVVGHSYGAFVALVAAMQNPDRFDRMVLIEPPVIPLLIDDPPRPSQLAQLFIKSPTAALTVLKFGVMTATRAQRAAKHGDLEAAVQIFGKGVLGRDRFDQLTAEQWAAILDNYTLAEFTGSGFPPLNRDEVAAVHTPAMLVNGSASVKLFSVLSDTLAEVLPDVERAVVAGASHHVPVDSPHLLAERILDFIAAG